MNAKRNKMLIFAAAIAVTAFVAACEHVEEEPEVNKGYATNIRVPDAEPLTPADSAAIDALLDEYNQNAK